jgi:hypothetical protein
MQNNNNCYLEYSEVFAEHWEEGALFGNGGDDCAQEGF